jgi:hypothetical protein
MSRRNGDRARFQKDRKRKLRHRQRIQALVQSRAAQKAEPPSERAAATQELGDSVRDGKKTVRRRPSIE